VNEAASQAGDVSEPVAPSLVPRKTRARLFRKYFALFVAVVCIATLGTGSFEIWFSYQEHKASLIRVQREQAEAAAGKIGQFFKEIEGQIGWTAQLPWIAAMSEQRSFDALRLLRQVPAITELTQIDSTGSSRSERLTGDAGRADRGWWTVRTRREELRSTASGVMEVSHRA